MCVFHSNSNKNLLAFIMFSHYKFKIHSRRMAV